MIWSTKRWLNRVFAFLLPVTEMNVALDMVEFCGKNPISQLEFRKSLAYALIHNEYFNLQNNVTPEKKAKKQQTSAHFYCMPPKRKKFMMDKCSNQRVHIHSTSTLPVHDAPMAIACVDTIYIKPRFSGY